MFLAWLKSYGSGNENLLGSSTPQPDPPRADHLDQAVEYRPIKYLSEHRRASIIWTFPLWTYRGRKVFRRSRNLLSPDWWKVTSAMDQASNIAFVGGFNSVVYDGFSDNEWRKWRAEAFREALKKQFNLYWSPSDLWGNISTIAIHSRHLFRTPSTRSSGSSCKLWTNLFVEKTGEGKMWGGIIWRGKIWYQAQTKAQHLRASCGLFRGHLLRLMGEEGRTPASS